ncbi:precorrin-6A synthase (deacetylating) [Actinosynnema sp. NPDC023587]|uniref:precorrin-6A synthase (deacetylating) n=1 Tax=Actinosynnema sp. NPDC023587 TaxID=3154695 RepID=UPI0033CF9AB9
MRTIHLIGIGAGDPEHITVQAVDRLREVDVFFLLDKGDATKDLVDARRAILERHAAGSAYRVVRADDADRDRTPRDYQGTVAEWHLRRADLYEGLFRDELRDGQVGAVLCWGDPTLYDNTIAVVEEVRRRGRVEFDYTVVPGVSSVSALVAAHRISLNRIGGSVLITTGRRLAADGVPADVDDVVVMLDAHCAFTRLDDPDLDIYWGAYLGTPDQLTVAGPLAEVAAGIPPLRDEARARKGWIMDTYLLRRRRR